MHRLYHQNTSEIPKVYAVISGIRIIDFTEVYISLMLQLLLFLMTYYNLLLLGSLIHHRGGRLMQLVFCM